MNMEIQLSHMSLPQLLELEKDIKVAREKLAKVVKTLPIVTINELKWWNVGNKVMAISIYRDRTGLGLYESRMAFQLVLEKNAANAEIK